jgi:hypothetical protein
MDSDKEIITDMDTKYKEYTEEIFNYNEINLVLNLIKEKVDKFDVWVY